MRRTGRGQETLNILYVVERKANFSTNCDSVHWSWPIRTRRSSTCKIGPLSTSRRHRSPEVLAAFKKYDRAALPVTDAEGHMLGIITADDVLDVAEQQATEDIQKMGGTESLDAPYLDVGYLQMIWKRGGWLSVLFLGEMLTATAMAHFEDLLAKAIVLTVFIPLIISSGGNSGSQAATLIVRSLALTELR